VPPLLIFLVEKFANINPVISGWSFSLRKKVSCKHNMSFVEILMPTINYGGVNEMIQRATICITMLLKII
jgi:hypothetical protein